jgi:hypothetical protein
MAQGSGGSGFGWFIIGIAVGAAGITYGPDAYRKYVSKTPEVVRVQVPSASSGAAAAYTPGTWQREVRFDIEYSSLKADGRNWDWPMTAPELQLCVRQGTEYRKCLGPRDTELATCQGKFRCTTGVIRVPNGQFSVELLEWDDYNQPDPIGTVGCDVGQTCQFQLGVLTVRAVGPTASR